ncbi:MAG: hypothetical protein ACREAS_10160, partial [Nitrososphaera sp.]
IEDLSSYYSSPYGDKWSVNLDLIFPELFSTRPNTGSASSFMTSLSNSFKEDSALILSPAAIALQNIMYKAKDLVHFQLLASSLASSDNEVLPTPTTLLTNVIS